jgi:hypothetical protein
MRSGLDNKSNTVPAIIIKPQALDRARYGGPFSCYHVSPDFGEVR